MFPMQLLDIIEGDVKHESDNHNSASGLHHLKNSPADRLASNAFDYRQHDVPAIQYGNRKKVQYGQIDIHDHAEPQRQPPAFRTLEQHVINIHYFDRATQVLGADVGFFG